MGTKNEQRANQQNSVACHVTMSPICSRLSSRGGGGIQRRGTEEGVAGRAAAATDIYAAGRQETSITVHVGPLRDETETAARREASVHNLSRSPITHAHATFAIFLQLLIPPNCISA